MHYIELVREGTGKRTLIPANDIGFSEDGNNKNYSAQAKINWLLSPPMRLSINFL